MRSNTVFSDDSLSYDEEEYDELNEDTFGTVALTNNLKGFNFQSAETKYRVEIEGEDIETVKQSLPAQQDPSTQEYLAKLANLSIGDNKQSTATENQLKEEDEIATYKTSIVDQFFLWINPQQVYMLSDIHNMNCRRKKLFNYTHTIPTLEDKMLNRIKLKFHASKYLFGVDIAHLVQTFQRKLAECSTLVPFNCDYYYWEHSYRMNPNARHLNRMLIADDMWLPPPAPSSFDVETLSTSHHQNQPFKPIRPPTLKYENALGSVSLSSVIYPRKVLSCDLENSVDNNKIHNPEHFSDIQKRYYVLSLIDKAIRLTIDYEIKSRVVGYQIQTRQKVEYNPQEMIQFQMYLGDFIMKIAPLYPFILNYTQGIELFNRVFFLLSDIHKIHVSKHLFLALKSNKVHPDQYSLILDDDRLVGIVMFGLGDVNEMNNHLGSLNFFMNLQSVDFRCTLFFWRFLEMVHTWLIPSCYSGGNTLPPPEYTLKFLFLLPEAIQSTQSKQIPPKKMGSIFITQQNILGAIKTINFKILRSPMTKQIISVRDTIVKRFYRDRRP